MLEKEDKTIEEAKEPLNRTNNFYHFFVFESFTPKERETALETFRYRVMVIPQIQELETQGGLWTRLKEEHSDLFEQIIKVIKEKRMDCDKHYEKFLNFYRARRFEEGDRYDQEVGLTEMRFDIWERLDPLLVEAEDILVSWGADRLKLQM